MSTTEKLEAIRHSLAHLLAAAVLRKYPDAQLAIGPAIDTGFYYDILFKTPPPISDLREFEKTMRELIAKKLPFSGREIAADEARSLFKSSPFKLELINELAAAGEKLTLYSTGGEFTDLCRGGHISNTSEIPPDSFELDRVAGAYWRGDESREQLTRIYGLAFENKSALEAYKHMREEAEKRDHRKLGKELDLFTFDKDIGPGLPLWLPKGAAIIEELEKLAKETENRAGYVRVRTPHIAKESLYLTSGHLPYYQDSMFPPMEYEGEKYYLKAMNCPHHHKLYAARPHSYRDLPLRMAEYGTVYRHEKTGELFGLMRVRMLSMNDAHIYCTEEQFESEFSAVNDIYLRYFKIFGIEKYLMRFSTHDPKRLGEKYVNEPALWKKTEDMVRAVLVKTKVPFVEIPNEAAFYGPKIDIQVWSAIGREFTLATNQVDFVGPKRFGLTFTDKDGVLKTPIAIHRAPLGTHERFIGFLIEHYGGAFPAWLAPIQAAVIPIGEEQAVCANEIYGKLRDADIRAELYDENESLGKKIRRAKTEKVPYYLIIGKEEVAAGKPMVESRDVGKLGMMDIPQLVDRIRTR